MEPIKVTFLGTSNGIPTKRRNHTALLVDYKEEHILVDCGEGTQRQFSYANKSIHKLTRVFITHWHGDHILGLPGLIQTLSLSKHTKAFHLYGPKGTVSWIERMRPFCGTAPINMQIHEMDEGTVFETKEFKIEARHMDHGTPALGYSFIIKEKRRIDSKKLKKLELPNSPLIGKLICGESIVWNGKKISPKSLVYIEPARKVTIIMDTKYNERAVQLAKNANLLISEASFSDEEREIAAERLHLTAKQAATIAKKAKADRLALVHTSQRYENNPSQILKEAKSVFKNVFIPNDLDETVV